LIPYNLHFQIGQAFLLSTRFFVFLLSEPLTVDQRSSLDLRLTYEASHRISVGSIFSLLSSPPPGTTRIFQSWYESLAPGLGGLGVPFDAAHQFPDLTEKSLPGRALFNFQGSLSFIA
jgi:hypothetical protein